MEKKHLNLGEALDLLPVQYGDQQIVVIRADFRDMLVAELIRLYQMEEEYDHLLRMAATKESPGVMPN